MDGGPAQNGLKGRHRSVAPVEANGLKMLVADAVTGEIGMAGRFVSETLTERLQGYGEVGASHARTLPIAVFGVNPIGSKAIIDRCSLQRSAVPSRNWPLSM